jgi:lysophospholipase L1-like esterase
MRIRRFESSIARAATILFFCACGSDDAPVATAPPPDHSRPVITNDDGTLPSPPATTSSTPSSIPTAPPSLDASAPDTSPPTPTTIKECFKSIEGAIVGPDYDQYGPKVGKNCSGTRQQTITGVEKLVFLGDSVTKGTPPTLPWDFYQARVTNAVKQKFGANIEVADCSKWGARTDDFLDGGNQIPQCFPTGVENKKTLVVMTMGGNDINAWQGDKLDAQGAYDAATEAAKLMGDALHWLKDPAHFPNGSYVVFANVYEYTDTSGELLSCPQAAIEGVSGTWKEGTAAVVHLQEEYMRYAMDTGTDMIFLLEAFCGHGYKRMDPSLQCYRGPNAELWFDLTCIHPNPKGHEVIANMFMDVIAP